MSVLFENVFFIIAAGFLWGFLVKAPCQWFYITLGLAAAYFIGGGVFVALIAAGF